MQLIQNKGWQALFPIHHMQCQHSLSTFTLEGRISLKLTKDTIYLLTSQQPHLRALAETKKQTMSTETRKVAAHPFLRCKKNISHI